MKQVLSVWACVDRHGKWRARVDGADRRERTRDTNTLRTPAAAALRPPPPRPVPPTRDPHTPGYVAAKELPDGDGAAAGRGRQLHHRADAQSRAGDDACRTACRRGRSSTSR